MRTRAQPQLPRIGGKLTAWSAGRLSIYLGSYLPATSCRAGRLRSMRVTRWQRPSHLTSHCLRRIGHASQRFPRLHTRTVQHRQNECYLPFVFTTSSPRPRPTVNNKHSITKYYHCFHLAPLLTSSRDRSATQSQSLTRSAQTNKRPTPAWQQRRRCAVLPML